MKFDGADTYPVGVLHAIKAIRRAIFLRDDRLNGKRLGIIRFNVRRQSDYLRRQIKARNWRAVRNAFNGYLCEHDNHPHNAGRGWTKRAAQRRAARLCAEASA